MPHLTLVDLAVYPLKGGHGISLDTGVLDRRGLRHDRRWMAVMPDGRFITQRTHPRLALVRPSLTADSLRFDAPGLSSLETPLAPEGPRRDVVVWNDRCSAVDVPAVGAWLSELLGEPVGVVHMPDDADRMAEPRGRAAGTPVSFADAYPFLLTTTASLDELNSRLAEPLPMTRFRPNLVLAGGAPFDEDRWQTVQIGELLFDLVKGCARCAVTRVDQETGEITGPEPLRTLATFRRRDGEVWFGQNAVHHETGMLRRGDAAVVVA